MAFPSKRPSDLVAELGLGKKRSSPPPMWDAKPAPYGAEEPAPAKPNGSPDICPACCKNMDGCKFYEPESGDEEQVKPGVEDLSDLGGEAA